MTVKVYGIDSKRVMSETLEGETIVINLESGNYYSLNRAGSALWDTIVKHRAIPVEKPDIAGFLDLLVKEQLISEESGSGDGQADQNAFENPTMEKYEDMREMLLADPIHDVAETGWPKLKDN